MPKLIAPLRRLSDCRPPHPVDGIADSVSIVNPPAGPCLSLDNVVGHSAEHLVKIFLPDSRGPGDLFRRANEHWDTSGGSSGASSSGSFLRRRQLAPGLLLTLRVEGRPVVLPRADAADRTPQVMLFSSGEMNLFELTLGSQDSPAGFRLRPAATEDDLEIESFGGTGT